MKLNLKEKVKNNGRNNNNIDNVYDSNNYYLHKQIQEIVKLVKDGNAKKVYKLKVWEEKKKEIWIRDNYECQECKKNGLVTTKKKKKLDIHHIKELKQYPELALDNNNLLTVCVRHHNILDNKNNMAKPKLLDNEELW